MSFRQMTRNMTFSVALYITNEIVQQNGKETEKLDLVTAGFKNEDSFTVDDIRHEIRSLSSNDNINT